MLSEVEIYSAYDLRYPMRGNPDAHPSTPEFREYDTWYRNRWLWLQAVMWAELKLTERGELK